MTIAYIDTQHERTLDTIRYSQEINQLRGENIELRYQIYEITGDTTVFNTIYLED